MSRNHKKTTLLLVRRILAILAAVLLCVTLFSGYMHFFHGKPATPPEPQGTEPTATDLLPMEPVEKAPTEPTQKETEDVTYPSEEETLPAMGTETPPQSSSSGSAMPEDKGSSSGYSGGPEHSNGTNPGDDAGPIDSPDHSDDDGHLGGPDHDGETAPAPDTTPAGDAEGAESTTPTILDLAEPAGGFGPDGMDGPQPPQDHDPVAIAGEIDFSKTVAFPLWGLIFWCALALLSVDLVALLFVNEKIRKAGRATEAPFSQPAPRTILTSSLPGRHTPSVATLHQPGRRQYQQDSLGHSTVLGGKGILAVVADGMGGLKDGDKVSQQIVLRTLELGAKLQPGQENGALYRILNQVNEDVNQTLTPEGLYKCGSTMIAVLVQDGRFQWISVGDSRIYLYRAGYVNRLNRDHDLLQEWIPEILNGQRTMEASLADPNARKLTSFIGMGRLRYVDGSVQPIDLLPGDRLVLMSDGVYGEVPEDQLSALLKQYPDVRQAAKALDQRVQASRNPHQDNYTALILGF